MTEAFPVGFGVFIHITGWGCTVVGLALVVVGVTGGSARKTLAQISADVKEATEA